MASRAERTLALGRFGTVEYAVRTDGTMEAKQWFDSQGAEVLASFGVLFQRLVDEGRIFNKTQFRPLQDEVWEFKRGDHRILCYRMGNRSLLTHRIKKAGGLGKCPPGEIRHAQYIGAEHIAWEMKNERKSQ